MYEFIVDMIVWGDCELTLTILMDLERSTNAKKNTTWFDHGDIQYTPCIDVVVVILFRLDFLRSNYYFEHLKFFFFFLRSNDYFEYLKLYFCKTVLFRILNYLIIIDL